MHQMCGSPECPTDFGDCWARGLPLSTLKGEPAVGFRARRTVGHLSAFNVEDMCRHGQ